MGQDENQGFVTELTTIIDENRDEIAMTWAHAIHEKLNDLPYGQHPIELICGYNKTGLDILKMFLRGEQYTPPKNDLPGSLLAREGIQVEEAVEAANIFREIIQPYIERSFAPNPETYQAALRMIDACAQEFVWHVFRNYSSSARFEIKRQQKRTGLLLDITRQVSRTLELDEILSQVAGGISSAAEADHCFIYLLDKEGNNGKLWINPTLYLSSKWERIIDCLDPSSILSNTIVKRAVVEKKLPIIINKDNMDDTLICNEQFPQEVHAILGVPFIYQERVLAVALVVALDGPREFTDDQIELAMGIANAGAPAIQNARLYKKVEQIAIQEERNRLAREIHDKLAQTLGAMQFRASIISDQLASEHWHQAEEGVQDLQVIISSAYNDVRDEINNLRLIASIESGFLNTLRNYLDDFSKRYNIHVHLCVDEKATKSITNKISIQVIRVIQEAVTNIRKHGDTTQAWVNIVENGSSINISIKDNGKGFDQDNISYQKYNHFGLKVMQERAEIIGGNLFIESQPGHGTSVVLSIPISRS